MAKNMYRRDAGLIDFTRDFADLRAGATYVVFIVIIDNFEMLTDAYGYTDADALISKLCDKIASKIGAVTRVTDNSLLIIAENNKDCDLVKSQLKTLISEFGATSKLNKGAHISALIDYSEVNSAQMPPALFDELYAKAKSHRFELESQFTDRKKSKTEMALANEISEALKNQRLTLAYQPVIEANTGRIDSYECLLRIVGADGKSSSAGHFIHVAEKMGIIENIDIHVLDMVFDKLEEDKKVHLSVNISNLSIGNPRWSKRFFERIRPETARRLTVEITETAVMLDLRSTAYFIATLQAAGCTIALDDFGSGYTSFRQIRNLSLDYIKIDGSLIRDITYNRHNQLLVKSLLEFLKGLKLKTIAEFVDGGDTAKFLIDCGVDYMQGNYFGEATLKIV